MKKDKQMDMVMRLGTRNIRSLNTKYITTMKKQMKEKVRACERRIGT